MWLIRIIFALFVGLVSGLAGCGKSAQEKVAEEQLKYMEVFKEMEKNAHKMPIEPYVSPEEWAYTKKIRTDKEEREKMKSSPKEAKK